MPPKVDPLPGFTHSICVRADGPRAITMAVHIREALADRGFILKSFLDSPAP